MAIDDRELWDRRHAERGRTDTVSAPAVFAPYAHHFPTAGTALDLACGAGAASVWLARRGLQVRGCDVSPVAVAMATELAERHGQTTRCRFDVVDLDGGLPPGDPVDVLLCNKFRDRRLDRAIVERIAAGGLLAIGVLSEVGAVPGEYRARAGELLRVFGALEVIAADEGSGQAWLLARA